MWVFFLRTGLFLQCDWMSGRSRKILTQFYSGLTFFHILLTQIFLQCDWMSGRFWLSFILAWLFLIFWLRFFLQCDWMSGKYLRSGWLRSEETRKFAIIIVYIYINFKIIFSFYFFVPLDILYQYLQKSEIECFYFKIDVLFSIFFI